MMNDTYGPMYAQPLMRFDQDTQSWRTSLDTSLWDLPMSSPTLPASGLMRNGVLFERPMLERPTSATGSSSLPTPRAQVRQDIYNREDYHYNLEEALATLPTPTVMDMGNNKTLEEWKKWKDSIGSSQTGSLTAAVLATLPTPNARDYKDQSFSPRVLDGRSHGELPEIVGRNFLPTPTAGDGTKASTNPDTSARRRAAGRQAFLTDIVQTDLMPTPTVMDMGNNKTPEEWAAWKDQQRAKHNNGNGHGESLTQAAIAWGKYEPAIRRWEALTREVPEPTVPHKDKRRINPDFVEWMMGLPEGHVTGHGLSAAKELKMLGNGVVPQQARSAVTQLMERITQ